MAKPERLNLWDRFFNRYRKEIHARGKEKWATQSGSTGQWIKGTDFYRNFVEYKIIDRLTGSERIKKEYLD